MFHQHLDELVLRSIEDEITQGIDFSEIIKHLPSSKESNVFYKLFMFLIWSLAIDNLTYLVLF